VRSFGPSGSSVYGLAADDVGNIYVAGAAPAAGAIDFAGDGAVTTPDASIGFLVALDPLGNTRWAHSLLSVDAGAVPNSVHGVTLAPAGDLFAAGSFGGQLDFADAGTMTSNGNLDGFIARVDPGTGAAKQLWTFGGTGIDEAVAIAPAPGGAAAVGVFDGTAQFGSGTLTPRGPMAGVVAFVAPPNGTLTAAGPIGADASSASLSSVAASPNGDTITGGYYAGPSPEFLGIVKHSTSGGGLEIGAVAPDGGPHFLVAPDNPGGNQDQTLGVAVDANGVIYATGA
jgi:hypothetical protein